MYIPRTATIGDSDGAYGSVTDQVSIGSVISHTADWWPHWVDTKTPEYSLLKKHLSLKYGSITFWVTLFIVLSIPLYDYLYDRFFYSNFNKVINYLKLPTLGRNNFIILNISLIKIIIFWTLVLSYLSFYETNQDWILIAKRLGRVPTICLPTVLFLSLRPSPLPNTLYLSLLPIHKWLSRLIVVQGAAHSVIYLAYFQHAGTWFKIYKTTNIHGIILMIAFIIIAITSIIIIRRYNYRFFYINHYLMSWIIVIFLYLHAKPGIPYITALNIAILLYQIWYRLHRTKKTKIDVVDISPTLSMILIPNTALSFKTGIPGCHIRISEYCQNKWYNWWNRVVVPLQHPYTLTTLPSDPVQKLIIKNCHFKFQKGQSYYVTGPFLPFVRFLKPRYQNNAKSLSFKVKCKRCLIVVGGSLISFALPIMRVLNYNGCSVKIVWVVRDIEDLKILNYYSNTIINDDSIDIFVTGNYSEESKNSFINSISEFDAKRKNKILQDQENLMNGMYQSNSSNKTPLKTEPSKSYGTTDNSTPIDLGLSKMERHGSDSSLSRKSSITDILFGNEHDDDELENVDVDLNCCDYDIEPVSPVLSLEGVSAGIDDSTNYEELDFSMDSTTNTTIDQIKGYSSLIKLNLGVAVKFGRPKLGGLYYNWCMNQACIGPVLDISRGESICCKDVPNQISGQRNDNNNTTKVLLNFKKSNGLAIGEDDSDALYMNEHFLKDRQKNKGKMNDDVWIIGAGPVGLVNNVRLWANDCGFHFHAESFSV